MMKKTIIAVAAVVLMASVLLMSVPVSADLVQDSEHYVYGDHPIIQPISKDAESQWSVTDQDGGIVPFTSNADGSITLDITGVDTVVVVQTVGGDTARSVLHAMHLAANDTDGDGKHIVTFHDRNTVVDTYPIDGYTVVNKGSSFVVFPEDPERNGYTFGGWYTDPSCSDGTEFDRYQPVYGNVDLYAKWTAVSGSGGIVPVGNGHVVEFETVVGLTHNIISVGKDSISFSVEEMDGFEFIESSITVSVEGVVISPVDGVYTIDGINRDIVVVISGEPVTGEDYPVGGYEVEIRAVLGLGYSVLSTTFDSISFTVFEKDGFDFITSSIRVTANGEEVLPEEGMYVVSGIDSDMLILITGEPMTGTGPSGDEPVTPASGFTISIWSIILIILALIILAVAVYILYRSRQDPPETA